MDASFILTLIFLSLFAVHSVPAISTSIEERLTIRSSEPIEIITNKIIRERDAGNLVQFIEKYNAHNNNLDINAANTRLLKQWSDLCLLNCDDDYVYIEKPCVVKLIHHNILWFEDKTSILYLCAPTFKPTPAPSSKPTTSPSNSPTLSPTLSPTSHPTTLQPTPEPGDPTTHPTPSPPPSPRPSDSPTTHPTASPTTHPTASPTTLSPSSSPTPFPTISPSIHPTSQPTTTPSLRPLTAKSHDTPTQPPEDQSISSSANSTHRDEDGDFPMGVLIAMGVGAALIVLLVLYCLTRRKSRAVKAKAPLEEWIEWTEANQNGRGAEYKGHRVIAEAGRLQQQQQQQQINVPHPTRLQLHMASISNNSSITHASYPHADRSIQMKQFPGLESSSATSLSTRDTITGMDMNDLYNRIRDDDRIKEDIEGGSEIGAGQTSHSHPRGIEGQDSIPAPRQPANNRKGSVFGFTNPFLTKSQAPTVGNLSPPFENFDGLDPASRTGPAGPARLNPILESAAHPHGLSLHTSVGRGFKNNK